jgi:SPP1 family predicted phage head-tail adaptor
MMDIRIGSLDHRLMLQAPSRSPDGGGGATITWLLVAEVWAAVRPLSGNEGLDAEGVKGRVTHEVWIRYRAGVKPEMRFLFGSRELDVRAVLDPEEQHRWLRCLCEERIP